MSTMPTFNSKSLTRIAHAGGWDIPDGTGGHGQWRNAVPGTQKLTIPVHGSNKDLSEKVVKDTFKKMGLLDAFKGLRKQSGRHIEDALVEIAAQRKVSMQAGVLAHP